MFNNFGMVPADPHTAYGSPGAYFADGSMYPAGVLPNATLFETPGGSISMASSVIGAEAMPAEACWAPPGSVPIALDVGGSGVVQDVQGGGGEEGTIAAFLPASVAQMFHQGESILTRRTFGVPNWIWFAGGAFLLLRK
jgi:hypothetical protein